jgi:hypothetical protein
MKFNRLTPISLETMSLLSLLFISPRLHAQEIIFHWSGAQNDQFGNTMATLADVSGDGIPEILVGAPGADCNTTADGAVYVYSGKDGTTFAVHCGVRLYKWYTDAFGASLADLGDVDGDNVTDYAIGGPVYYSSLGDGAGRVCVYSGKDGALMYQLEGEQKGIHFGATVAGIGDIDADGRADLLVAATEWADVWPSNAGRAYVYSGATGALIRSHDGEEEYDHFGYWVAGIGDVDADGTPDYAVTAQNDYPSYFIGVVFVYSGATGTLLYRWAGDATHFFFGVGVTGQLDWNGDGFGDIIVGGAGNLNTDGYVYVYSGKDGTILASAVGETFGTQFGYSVANVGDMNDDGYPEILAGEPLNSDLANFAGRVTLLSGRTLRRLYHFYGSGRADMRFGFRVAGGRDYNGDGIPDVMSSELAGDEATLFAGNDLFLQATKKDVTAGDSLTIDTRGGGDGVLAALVLKEVNGTACFLSIQIGSLDVNGEMALDTSVPSGLAGITLKLQSYALRQNGQRGIVDSSSETISIY